MQGFEPDQQLSAAPSRLGGPGVAGEALRCSGTRIAARTAVSGEGEQGNAHRGERAPPPARGPDGSQAAVKGAPV